MIDEEIKEYWQTAYYNEKYKKEELEKENAELKADFIKSCKVKEQGFREAEQALEHKDDQLTKAKELLKMVLDWQCRCGNGHPTWQEVCAKIEQFLKEVEK